MSEVPPEFLDTLRSRLSMSEVLRPKVKLVKSGREFKGLSPFSIEKSPSFFVNDKKGQFFDFSTGKNGDIFAFVMESEGVSFEVAVSRLAEMAGLPLPAGTPSGRRDLRGWLRQQPFQVSVVYAARAALRAVPELVGVLGPRGGGARQSGHTSLLPAFRAVAAAWNVSRLPNRAGELRASAASAAEAAFAAASSIDSDLGTAACEAAARAAAAAARAA
jgi:hypothetical protein